jgi:sRNA-binding carbon storage regulator CsrA
MSKLSMTPVVGQSFHITIADVQQIKLSIEADKLVTIMRDEFVDQPLDLVG